MPYLANLLESLEPTESRHQAEERPEQQPLPESRAAPSYSNLEDANGERLEQLLGSGATQAELSRYLQTLDPKRKKIEHERMMRMKAAREARQLYARKRASHDAKTPELTHPLRASDAVKSRSLATSSMRVTKSRASSPLGSNGSSSVRF